MRVLGRFSVDGRSIGAIVSDYFFNYGVKNATCVMNGNPSDHPVPSWGAWDFIVRWTAFHSNSCLVEVFCGSSSSGVNDVIYARRTMASNESWMYWEQDKWIY